MKQTNRNTTQQSPFHRREGLIFRRLSLDSETSLGCSFDTELSLTVVGQPCWWPNSHPAPGSLSPQLTPIQRWINGKNTNKEIQGSRQRQGDCTKYTQCNSSAFWSSEQFIENCDFNLTDPELQLHQSLLSACQPPNKYIPSSLWEF